MTGDEYILAFHKHSEHVDTLAEKLAEKRAEASNGTRMMTNIRTDKTNDVTRRIEDVAILIDHYERELAELFSMEIVVLNMIHLIDNNIWASFLISRYVLGYPYEQISVQLGISIQHLYHINRESLELLKEIEL